jgi:hypothetical protein
VQVPTAAESCALERQVVGGSRSVRRALVSPLILLLRRNHTNPHACHVAAIRDAHIRHDVNAVPRALGSSCDALARASVRVVPSPSLYSLFTCAMGFAAWGNGGRRTRGGAVRAKGGALPIARARPSRLRRLHTIADATASCLGGIVKRSRGGERDGRLRAAPSVMRRTSRQVGMWVGRVQRRASSCGVHGAGFGLEFTAASHEVVCLHAAERGGWRYWSIWQ